MTHAEFVEKLVACRHARGLTQQQVASRMSVCRSTVTHFETRHGGRMSPNLSTVLRYAAAIGATVTIAKDAS